MKEKLRQFIHEESGPTAVEYAIMIALVALAIAIAQPNLRDAILNIFAQTTAALQGVGP